ncbi:hypothetical protein [Bradyrhizobium sp. USDA 4486]
MAEPGNQTELMDRPLLQGKAVKYKTPAYSRWRAFLSVGLVWGASEDFVRSLCLLLRQIGCELGPDHRRAFALTIVDHPTEASHANEKSVPRRGAVSQEQSS